MEVFFQLIYEYQHEMRDLCLFTISCQLEDKIKNLLKKHKIDFKITHINDKINVFFGNADCLKIFSEFSSENLDNITTEEDFILGIMLGYGKKQQYKRFLNKKNYYVAKC